MRAIVKDFGTVNEPLTAGTARNLLRNIVKIQQLGVIHLDMAHRQLVNGKIADFSTALTTPHYMVNPELNPNLTPEWKAAVEFETFQFSIADYQAFDNMIDTWNDEHGDKVLVWAFPNPRGGPTYRKPQSRYNLRGTQVRQRVCSLVDPRRYDWKTDPRTGGRHGAKKGVKYKRQKRLLTKPPKWVYYCDYERAAEIKSNDSWSTTLEWEFRDGLIFPRKKRH